MVTLAAWIVFGLVAATLLVSWAYYERCAIARPPLGVINGWDVGFMLAMIVAATFLNLWLPAWLVVALLSARSACLPSPSSR